MSKLWTNQFGDGRESDSRGLRIRRGVLSLCLGLGLLVSAASAWAAEVVEVRVGRHPEFTRLVFELDRAVGYRIQRTHAGADSELVISLEATSIPRSLRSSKTLIEQVDLSPSGSRSVARIKLTEDGFRLKEMILSSPPRIVLDLVKDAPIAKASPSTKTASKSSSAAAKLEAQQAAAAAEKRAAEKRAAELAAKAEAAAAEKKAEMARVAEAAKAKAAAAEAKAKEVAQATAAAAKAKADAAAKATADAAAKAAEKSQQLAANAKNAASAKTAEAAAGVKKAAEELSFDEIVDRNSDPSNAAAATAAAAGAGAAENAKRAPAPNVAKTTPKPKTPRPMVAKQDTGDDQGWMKWALMAAGALVVVGAGLLFARRRGGSEEVDFSEEADLADAGDDAVTGVVNEEDENPFADLSGAGAAVAASDDDATVVTPFGEEAVTTPFADDDGMDGEATTIVPLPDDEKESETMLFESTQENDMDDMEVISRDQVNESLGDAAMPPMGGIPEEFQQMMREMNSRVQALEGRVDELVDARDRLERQVAAQTEELRVQRAAIARTQRAVRNLARPEDAGEDEATEPALRDPNQ